MKRARVAALALLLTGCSVAGDPVTEQGHDFRRVWNVFLPIAIAVVVLIWALVLFAAVRYRRREDAVPNQNQYRVTLEVIYTGVPLVLVAGLFALSVSAENEIDRTTDHPDVAVTVHGFQWSWQFQYDDLDFTVAGAPGVAPLLVLPVDRTTQFDLVADDVIHSFWVPAFLSKRDLIPGIENRIDITPTATGSWAGHCAEFCGLDHWKMNFEVEVVPQDVFDRWVAAAQQAPDPYSIPRPEDVAG
jgi:cytochrome c oxidase subunit 2